MNAPSRATAEGDTVKSLILPTLRNLLLGTVGLSILLFIPAWTLDYWQAWIFIMIVMIPLSVGSLYFSIKDPALLERRKKAGPIAEQSIAQKIFVTIALLSIDALLVFVALDHRFGWSQMSPYVSLAGDGLIALTFLIWFFVFTENSYAASIVQTFEGQKVISTGLYALVRHPMYMGFLVMLIGIPLALGSWWGLAFLVLEIPLWGWRILDEEKLLKKDLPGYTEYTRKARYRLVPYLW